MNGTLLYLLLLLLETFIAKKYYSIHIITFCDDISTQTTKYRAGYIASLPEFIPPHVLFVDPVFNFHLFFFFFA